MSYCSNCGTHIAGDDKFCFKCGTPAKRPSLADMASDPKNLFILVCSIVCIVFFLLFLSASRSALHKQDARRPTGNQDSVQLANMQDSIRLAGILDSFKLLKKQAMARYAAGYPFQPQAPDSTQKPVDINPDFEKNLKNTEYMLDDYPYTLTDGSGADGWRIEKIYSGDINSDGVNDAVVQLIHNNKYYVIYFMLNDTHNIPLPIGSFDITETGEVITNVVFNKFAYDQSRTITRINTLKVGLDDLLDHPTKNHSYYWAYVNDSLLMVKE
jgi:hypothetical protein